MRNWKDKISDNISYTEATKSITAKRKHINNIPDKDTVSRMKYVAENLFEPLRKHFGVPIGISSFYRSEALNQAVGGSKTSEHVYGSAMDIDADIFGLITNKDIFDYIKDNLEFNQLIWEYGDDKEPDWVHASLKEFNNKKQILKACREKNWKGNYITKYKNYE
jgi:hypothetical protein